MTNMLSISGMTIEELEQWLSNHLGEALVNGHGQNTEAGEKITEWRKLKELCLQNQNFHNS